MKFSIFVLLHVMIYLDELSLGRYTLFFFKRLEIFFDRMLFVITVVLENKYVVAKLTERYEIKMIIVSTYHP